MKSLKQLTAEWPYGRPYLCIRMLPSAATLQIKTNSHVKQAMDKNIEAMPALKCDKRHALGNSQGGGSIGTGPLSGLHKPFPPPSSDFRGRPLRWRWPWQWDPRIAAIARGVDHARVVAWPTWKDGGERPHGRRNCAPWREGPHEVSAVATWQVHEATPMLVVVETKRRTNRLVHMIHIVPGRHRERATRF